MGLEMDDGDDGGDDGEQLSSYRLFSAILIAG
jgi:hypothetical protein